MSWFQILLIILGSIVGLFLLYALFLTVCSLFIDTTKEYESNSPFYRFLLVTSTWMLLHVLRLRITVEGEEKLPDGRYLLICNHRSKYDPMIAWVYFRNQTLSFISKPENFKIPVFGRFIRKCGFLPIDRENPRNAMLTISKAARMIQNDVCSIGIFPEGTRSKTTEMLPFRNGCLKIAQDAQVPIVVMAMTGTQKIHRYSPWKRVHVHMAIVDVIPTETVLTQRRHDLSERARDAMQAVLDKEEL